MSEIGREATPLGRAVYSDRAAIEWPLPYLRCPRPVSEIATALGFASIIGGYDLAKDYPHLGDAMLVCVTEMNTRQDIDRLVPVIINELERAGDRIGQDELDRARAQYRAGLIMSGESAASRASQIARQLLLFGRPIPKEELMERLSALTVDRLTDLSARLFSTKPTLTAVGPVGTLAPYEAVLDALPRSHATAHRLAV